MVITGPISSAILPRMARLHAEGRNNEMIAVYRNSTQLVSVIAGSAAITLVCCAEQLLFAWTGDTQLAEKVAPILRLYAIGNGFLAVAAFPYYLQYAKGILHYHLVGNAGMAIVLIPSIVYAASNFGSTGAGYVWLCTNALFLLTWVAYVHHKLEPGLHFRWLSVDILLILLPPVILAGFLMLKDVQFNGRIESLLYVVSVGGLLIVGTMSLSGFVRAHLRARLYRKKMA